MSIPKCVKNIIYTWQSFRLQNKTQEFCWSWATDSWSCFWLAVPTSEYPCVPSGFLYGVGAVDLLSNSFLFSGNCVLHSVLNNFKRWNGASIIFNLCFSSLQYPLLKQQLSNFNVHNKVCRGTCYNCRTPDLSPRFWLCRSGMGLGIFFFPHDSDAGGVQMTLWGKTLDFILLHGKLNMIIIIFK